MIRYSVTFQLLPRALKDGTHSVAVTVTYHSRRWRHTLPVSCPPDKWQAAVQLARPFQHSADVNEAVLHARESIDRLFSRCDAENRLPISADLDSIFSATPPEERRTLDRTIDEFVTVMTRERSWQHGTAVKFAMLRRELHAVGVTYLDEIDERAEARFHDYHAHKGLRNSTLAKKVNILNWFLRWSNSRGYTDAPIARPHLRLLPRVVTYLEWDELMHLYNFDFAELPHLNRCRDVFCFCCFTGLRYSDCAALRWEDIRDDTLHVVTQKTADRLEIPLNRYARAILDRYRDAGTRLALPVTANPVVNRQIKDAAMLAGLDRPIRQTFYRGSDRFEEEHLLWESITHHWARRSFVVHALRLGIPAEVVMKFTGHNDYKAMQPYIAIADDLKRAAMSKFDDA